jgi:hypothetical protein
MVEPLQESMCECTSTRGVEDPAGSAIFIVHVSPSAVSSLRGSIIGSDPMAIFPGCVCLSSRQSYR